MIIGIDGNEANVSRKVGVSVYTYELICGFKKIANKDLQFNIYLRNNPLPDLPSENKYFRYQLVWGKFLWSQIFLPLNLFFKRQTDVFFSPAHYVPRYYSKPLIVTIHDLSYFYYPDEFLKKDLYKLQNWTKHALLKAKKIIAVSKATKKDIVKFYKIPDDRIEVIYNGYQKTQISNAESQMSKKNGSTEIKNFNLIKKYILFVGTLQPRKNIITLIKAFKKFYASHQEFKLIIAGRKGWLYDEIYDQVNQIGLKNEVIFTDYISDKELIELYKKAFCFIMPSFYEGFGIPILEAMSFNCPVIASFASSLPEIGGDACLYFNPNDENDLLDKINNLLENESLRNELINKGKERIKLFSWKSCVEKTLAVIQSAY